MIEIKYPSSDEFGSIYDRGATLGYPKFVDANLNKLGQSLFESPSPRLKSENKLWRAVKETRQKQAQWRAQERQKFMTNFNNPDMLDREDLWQASKIFVSLKERRCSYGDSVFNFGFVENGNKSPAPVKIPNNLPQVIWKMAEYVEKPFPKGLAMARVDAIRQPDNNVKIIEVNPCWVDNFGALQAFYETYQPLSTKQPVDILLQQIIDRRPPNRNMALLYCNQAVGCQKDEIYGLASYLQTKGYFEQITVAPLDPKFDLTPYGSIYLNGSFVMGRQFIGENQAIDNIIKRQEENKVLLLPSQFTALDSKSSLIGMSQIRPDLFVCTSSNRQEIDGPTIAKPLLSESLKGIAILRTGDVIDGPEKYIYQPIITNQLTTPLNCVDTTNKSITRQENLYEKINIWIVGSQIAGVMAAYDKTPMINDASYNFPIGWTKA